MLSFDAETHSYTLAGKPVPGVTSVLSAVQDFSGVPPDVLERKRQIGTALHAAIDMGDDLDPESLDDLVQPYYRAWQKFMIATGFQPMLHEQQVYSVRFGFAGTLDAIGTLGSRDVLIDYKSAWELHPATGPQTAAYLYAASEMGLCAPNLPRFALQLRADENYRLQPLTEPTDFAIFASLLSIWNWRKRHGLT